MRWPHANRAGAPTATYRLQLRTGFGFDEAARIVGYLAALGVSHLYLSPIQQAAPGSTHGYDVLDHSRLSADLGGAEGFRRLVSTARSAGLGLVVDVVPNHMALPTPATLNARLWSVLREGPTSPYARWFDIDWTVPDRAMLMPRLGRRIGECLEAGEISLDTSGAEPLVRYADHVLPVRPGTESLPLPQLLDRQWYRLAYWRVAHEELNYRRFFDIDTLAAIRVELPEVFEESHRLLLDMVAGGAVDGLRIDHPDGLADPRGYLDRLAKATGGCWVVVEKILEGSEVLPPDWTCAGTTGYDALLQAGGLFVDPAGAEPLAAAYHLLTEDTREFSAVVREAKRHVVQDVLYAEVSRLVQLLADICHGDIALRDHTRRGLEEALTELLVAFPVYRAYVVPGEPAPPGAVATLTRAADEARDRLREERHATVDLVCDLALGRRGRDAARDEFVVRFQQTTGPVMAKGVEDTAFYRWFRLACLNEVGGDPDHFGVPPSQFHAFCARLQRDWPLTMTTLSTHDTKRSEDVRARLAVLSELPDAWTRAVTAWRAAAAAHHSDGWPDPVTEYLLWQTVVGAWPLPADRLVRYLEKATREAKRFTSWTTPDEGYDRAVRVFAERVLGDDPLRAQVQAFVERLAPHAQAVTLGQKLVQLTMPGVPDVYQGAELEFLALVDPDNRQPVDYEARRALLRRLDEGGEPVGLSAEKLLVVSRALRLRREHPEWFGAEASYEPLVTSTEHAAGFSRAGRVAVVASRLTAGLARRGGWADDWVTLPSGSWRDELSGRTCDGGRVSLGQLLDRLPVALLTR
jgi:(1->4)-alpha-D-glucan 1-alpha-D-glucosylmutase